MSSFDPKRTMAFVGWADRKIGYHPAWTNHGGEPMSLSDLASLGSFVSGLAVLISLIYLAIQVQQAEQNQKAQIQQGRAARLVDLQLRLADSANAEIYVRGMNGEAFEAATDVQRFRGLILASLYSMEDTFLQHKAGLLARDTLFSRRSSRSTGIRFRSTDRSSMGRVSMKSIGRSLAI
jgi:hypothetical protein